MIDIVQKGDEVLNVQAKEVPIADITSKEIQKVLDDMRQALVEQDDGVAIAAPQIGVSLQIFIVSKRVFTLDPEGYRLKNKNEKDYEDLVFINPEIINRSRKTKMMSEGCLSVRWIYGKVDRAVKATVKAYDENGELFIRGGSDLMAQIYQHETDHLNGTLFVEKAKNLEHVEPPKK